MLRNIILGSLIVIPIGGYYYHGFNESYPISGTKLSPQRFIYHQHTGPYIKIFDSLKSMEYDLRDYKDKLKNGRLGVVYYDDPGRVEGSACRAVYGIFYESSEKNIEEELLKNKPEYESKQLPELNAVKVTVPYKSAVTHVWKNFVIYPKLYNYLTGLNLDKKDLQDTCILELYNNVEESSFSEIDIHVPYGPNVSTLMLSKAPQPPLLKKRN